MLDTLALGIGRHIVRHATSTWLGHRKAKSEQESELIDLVAVEITDEFSRRKLTRQLEDIGDHVAQRLSPLIRTELPDLPDHEREAALAAVSDTLTAADLSDSELFAADLDPVKVARAVRARVPDAPARSGLSEPGTALYELVLSESCLYLVHVIRQLPAFQPRALTEFLGRFSAVSDQIEQVLQRLPRPSLNAPREQDAEFTRRYLTYLSETLDQLELFGVDTRRYRPRTSVSVAYLGLTVAASGRLPRRAEAVELWPEDRFVPRNEEGLRVEFALAGSTRILLRGEAGSGKTTLLQWIAVNAARGTFTGSLAGWNGTIPFFVRLRAYPDATLPQPENMLTGEAGPLAGQAPEGWAHRQFTFGTALLLVDGVDELSAVRRPRVRRWLSQLLAAFPETQVVVTSRPSAAEENWLTEHGFTSLLLEPMTAADITVFCRRWHDAIREWGSRTGGLPCTVSELDGYESALQRHLDARRHLRTLATNPLLCAMLCALNLDRRMRLPSDRMKLYEAALDLLIDRRDAEREVPANHVTLDGKSKVTILQHLAWWLTLNGRAEATLAEAETQVELAITHMPDVDLSSRETLRFLLERSGIIREPVTGRVDFIHRTFQEYLAGKHAADHHSMDFVITNAHLDQWRETIIMAAGHAALPLRGTLLDGLLGRADREPRHARRLRLVAAACLETTHTVAPDVAERVEAPLDRVIPPRRVIEARSLTVAGERLLRRLPTTLEHLTPASAAACVRAAALTGGPESFGLLAKYATDPRPKVQYELADVWKYFPAERYAKAVLAHAPLDGGAIRVSRIEHTRHLRHLQNLRETQLLLNNSEQVDDLRFLADAPNMTRISFFAKPDTTLDLHPLAEHSNIETMHLFSGSFTRLDSLSKLPLVILSIRLPADTTSLEFISPLSKLRTATLNNCTVLRDCADLAKLKQLRHLSIDGIGQQLDPGFFQGLETVRLLTLFGELRAKSWAKVLDPVLPRLDFLNLASGPLPDLNILTSSRLKRLWIQNPSLPELSPLRRMTTLQEVRLAGTVIPDLGPLRELPALSRLVLSPYFTNREFAEPDVSSLAALSKRITIELWGRVRLRGRELLGPEVRIVRRRY